MIRPVDQLEHLIKLPSQTSQSNRLASEAAEEARGENHSRGPVGDQAPLLKQGEVPGLYLLNPNTLNPKPYALTTQS